MGRSSLTADGCPAQRLRTVLPGVHSRPLSLLLSLPLRQVARQLREWSAQGHRRQLLKTILPAEETAAIVIEPVQGEGGYIVPPENSSMNLPKSLAVTESC